MGPGRCLRSEGGGGEGCEVKAKVHTILSCLQSATASCGGGLKSFSILKTNVVIKPVAFL